MGTVENDVSDVEHQITTYLGRHPQAADSVEGIAAWWLPKTVPPKSLDVVRAALDRLVASGAVRSEQLPDGRVVYSASRRAP